MNTRYCAFIVLCMLATGCSTTVHLYTRGLEADKAEQLSVLLREQGFNVKKNARAIPRQVVTPMLVYSPLHSKPGQLELLDSLLVDAGYSPEWIIEKVGNNAYTGRNVGLYLVPYTQPENAATSALAGRMFHAFCKGRDTYLDFDEYGGVRFEVMSTDVIPESDIRIGSWSESDEQATVFIQDQQLIFRIVPFTAEIFTSREAIPVEAVRLLPGDDYIGNCEPVWRPSITL